MVAPFRTVHIYESLVIKIIKHCKECLIAFATGKLLGLNIGSVWESRGTKKEDVGHEHDDEALTRNLHNVELDRGEIDCRYNVERWMKKCLLVISKRAIQL